MTRNNNVYTDKQFENEMDRLYKKLFSAESILKEAKQNYEEVHKENEQKLKEILKKIGD